MKHSFFVVAWCLFFISPNTQAFGEQDAVSYEVSYYIDSTNLMSQEAIRNIPRNKFVKIDKPSDINFGFNNFSVWMLLKLKTEKSGKDYVLSIENAHLDSLKLYKYSGEKVLGSYTGDHLKFSSREFKYNMFLFTLPDSCDFFLIKVRSEGLLSIPVQVNTMTGHIKESNADVMVWSVFFGVLFLAFSLNMLLYFRMAEKVYLMYVLCLVGNAVLNATDAGILFQFVWPNYPVINHYAGALYGFSIFSILFGYNILSLEKQSRLLHYLFYAFGIGLGILVVINIAGYYSFSMKGLLYYFYLITLLFLFSGVYVYFVKKYKPAFYYMIAWSTYSIGAIIYIMASDGILPFNFYTKSALEIGNILEIIFLFMAVIDKIYEFRKAKEDSDLETLRLIEENRRILFNQNQKLELMVLERTSELSASREQLEKQNETIHHQNELLSEKEKVLQQLVKKRTLALQKANQVLVDKNNALEKFAYFTAHNIRGPVSSILGLTNLFSMVNKDQMEMDKVIGFVKQSADHLDEVVRDMITLLTLNNMEDMLRSELTLSSLYKEEKETFLIRIAHDPLVSIEESFKEERVHADEVMVKYIVSQLFDNAYKFRIPGRDLVIRISEELEEGKVCFSFSDNGSGFDAEKYEKDVFGLYKRFHSSSSGKGLGLYFVNEYMRKMKGSAVVKSKKGKGTVVKLYFERVG